MLHKLTLAVLSLLIIVHLLISPDFSLTWDFPHHFLAGLIRLREIDVVGYQHKPYGVFTQLVPVVFSRFFPTSWFPTSYLLFSVIIGSISIVFYYLLLRQAFGERIAFLSSVTVFLLPRFVGHLHTNTKDVVTASFFIICVYFLNQFLGRHRFKDLALSILFYTLAVNTKITAIQLFPLIVAWIFFFRYFILSTKKSYQKSVWFYLLVLSAYLVVPILVWFLLWPGSWQSFFSALYYVQEALSLFPKTPSTYAFEQLLVTTPTPIVIFALLGIYVLYQRALRKHHHLSFFFSTLLFYSVLKYPIFGLAIIDDIRYFIEIYFALSLSFVLGVDFLTKRYAPVTFFLVFFYLLFIQLSSHPYQINYYNFLAKDQDADFWAASYREVFSYINNVAPQEAIVSARLAPELAGYYIREDLRRNLNSRPPKESDIVVILNRASFFKLYQVEEFVASQRPTKVFTDRGGRPLSFVYIPGMNH